MEVMTCVVLRLVASIFAIGCATYLMFNKIDGWGWLLFIAVLLGSFTLKTGS